MRIIAYCISKLESFKSKIDAIVPFSENKTSEQTDVDNRPLYLFIATIFLYPLYIFIFSRREIVSGEMWAEMANNYFLNAASSEWHKFLFATDAGYIPFPQRIIALLFELSGVKYSLLPFFYNGSALIISAAIVGVFCLKPFRSLIEDDWLRFLVVALILITTDFELRNFINFTYFVGFFIIVNSALGMITEDKLPKWSWFIPFFLLSKPTLLATVPGLVYAALFRNRNLRKITIISCLVSIVQMVQIFISHKAGIFAGTAQIGFFSKLLGAIFYSFASLGTFLIGKSIKINATLAFFLALFVLRKGYWFYDRNRRPSNALVVLGLFAILFNSLIATFTMSDAYNIHAGSIPWSRHLIVGFYGVILLFAATSDNLAESSILKSKFGRFSLLGKRNILFGLWVLIAWAPLALHLSNNFKAPAANNCYWQKFANTINDSATMCFPINPMGWSFLKNCETVDLDFGWGTKIWFKDGESEAEKSILTLEVPQSVNDKPTFNLHSFALIIQPRISTESTLVEAHINEKNGHIISVNAERMLNGESGVVLLQLKESIPFNQIKEIEISTKRGNLFGFTENQGKYKAAIYWYGSHGELSHSKVK